MSWIRDYLPQLPGNLPELAGIWAARIVSALLIFFCFIAVSIVIKKIC